MSCRYDLPPHQLEALPRLGLPAHGDSPRSEDRRLVLCSAPSSPGSPGSSSVSGSDGGDSSASWGYISSCGVQGPGCSLDGKTPLWSRRLKEKPLMSIVTYGEAGPQNLGGVLPLVLP